MPKSDYLYLSGEPADVGVHGEHDYFYHSGEPVTDSGLSAYVFESGTGLGGGELLYEINGGGLKTLETIKSAEPHYKFYNSSTSGPNDAGDPDHGYYWSPGSATVLAHENTNDGSIALITTFGEPGVDDGYEYELQVDFSTTIDESSYRVVWDGELDESGDDWFTDSFVANGWSPVNADGWGIDVAGIPDVTFTISSYDHDRVGNESTPVRQLQGWRLITQEGPPPDGGGYEWINDAGPSGSLRIVANV